MTFTTKLSPGRLTPDVIRKLRGHHKKRNEWPSTASQVGDVVVGVREASAPSRACPAAILIGLLGLASCEHEVDEGSMQTGRVPVALAGAGPSGPSPVQAAAGSLKGEGGTSVVTVGGASAIAVGGSAVVGSNTGGAISAPQTEASSSTTVAGAPPVLGMAGSASGGTPPTSTGVPDCGVCSSPTPACNLATRTCVGCIDDSQCAAPTPACSTSQTCVACTNDAYCSGATPICNPSASACVQCLSDGHCTNVAGKPYCDPTNNVCVGCRVDADCSGTPSTPLCSPTSRSCTACQSNANCLDASASRCDPSSNSCGPCVSDADCSQIAGKSICLAGTQGQPNRCVQCTAANEQACVVGGVELSCNPAESQCTSTPKGSRLKCQTCVADSDCFGGNIPSPTARCVPMLYQGQKHGAAGYCLQRRASGPCPRPYTQLLSAVSLSGEPAENYCGIHQDTATCEAVLDMLGWKSCSIDNDCGMNGGLCRNFAVPTAPPDFRCTIQCGDALQCTTVRTCKPPPLNYCQ